MHQLILPILFIFLAAFESQAQTIPQTPTAKPALDPIRLADEWLNRLNALDDWYLSTEGKEEGITEVVDHMMELYAPEVLAEVPPHDEHQIGPVVLRGSGNLRKWVEKIARNHVRLAYIHKRQTGGIGGEFEGALLIHSAPLPWGGLGISFQILGVYSLREDRRRILAPGAVFLQFGEDGKIHRLRLLLAEQAEVVPL